MRKLFTLLTSFVLLAWMAVPEAQAQGTACGTATVVGTGTHLATSPTTVGGTYDAGCFGGGPFNAGWYSYTPAASGAMQVTSCAAAVDTRVSIFTGCGVSTCVGFNDDAPCGNFASDATVAVTGGTTYYIQWDDRWGDVGNFSWDLNYTPCATLAAAAAFPYTENLDNGGALAATWNQDVCDDLDWTVNTGGTGSVNTGPDAAQSGAWYIYTETSGVAAGAVASMYPQPVNMTGSTTPRLNFYYHMRGAAMTPDGTIDIDVSPSGSVNGPWTNIFTQSGEIGNVWNQGLVSLAAYAANPNLAFRINGTVSTTAPSFENDFGIDTWRVEDTPACNPPTAGNATSITASGATLGWTAGGTEGVWDLDVVLAGAGVSGSPSNPGTTNPTVVTGLSSGTDYEFWVRADCIINGTSTWEGPYPFTTNPSCGDSWYDTGGPGGNYSANESEVTTICGTGSDFVEATFNGFATENGWDALYVFNGPSTASPIIPSGNGPTTGGFPADGYTGTTIPGPFTSTDPTGCLTFEFLSDGSGQLAGWDVSIACVTCPAPSTFAANTITSSSAQIGGTISPSHLNYDMEIGPTGFTPGAGTSALGVGNNHPFTGLAQNTTYDVYVYGNCVGPTQSTLFGPITFTTLCGTQTYPYTEDWEDGGNFDQCWTQEVSDNFDFIVGGPGGTPSTGTGPAGPQSGTYYLYIEATGAVAGSFATMYSPPINMSGSVTPRLNLYYQNNGANMTPDASTIVDISTTGAGGPWTNVTTISGDQGASWLQDFSDLTAYAANTVTFRVTSQMSSGGGFTNDLAIDDFILEEAPACAAPNALTAAPASNTADLSWNEVGTATLWDIEFGAAGFVPTGTPTTAGTTNPHTETGLATLTDYDYYVRADCGSGSFSTWSGPYTFTTAPGCGDNFYDNGGPAGNYSANSNDVTTICGNLTTEVVVATFTSFTVEQGWDALYVYDGPSTASPIIASGQPATTNFPADGYGGTTPPGPFASTDPTGCLTFEFLSDASVNQAGFAATIACVTCLPPTAPALVGVTGVSGTISWTPGPSAVSEVVNWGPTGFIAGTGTNIPAAMSPTTITGLAPNTTYDAYIQTDCGGGDLSPWVGPITFTTLCAANAFPYTEDFEDGGALDACWAQETSTDDFNWTVQTGGTTSTGTGPSGANSPIYYLYTETSGTANNDIAIVYSPLINMTGAVNPRLNCAYHALGLAMANGGSITWDISTNGTAGPWTNVFTQTGNTGVDQWFNATANLSAYIGQTVMFRVTGINSTSGSSFQNDHAIDDFLVEETPPCVDPSGLAAIGISGTEAQITFTGDPGAVDYEIEHVLTGITPNGTPTVTGIVGSPYTLTGLTASSVYDVYVRANCGVVNGNSNWIGPVTFSTLCPAFALDYIEDFEDGGALDACWSQETSSDDFDWTVNSGGTTSGGTGPTGAFSVTYYIYTETSGTSNGDVAIIYSPQVDLNGASDPRLNMMYHMLGAAMAPDGTIDVDISTAGPLGPWTNVFSQSGPQGAAWQQALPNLSAYIGNVVMFRITGTVSTTGSSFQNDFAIDDFGVEETPLCPVPSGGYASATTATTADLDWTVGGAEVLWNTEVGLAGFTPNGTPTSMGVVQNYQETGLTSGTDYEFYLQADCQGSDGVSNWVGPFAFSTALTCGDNFTDTGGAGGNYSVNESGVNTICGDGTNFALVTFTAFNTESGWDALYVYDGPTTGSPIIPSGQTMVGSSPFPDDGYTGTSIPGPFTSTDASGCLTFQFLSDGSVTRPGWEANVTCVTCLPIEVASTSVTGLTSTTATLNWACAYCTSGYVVEWDVAGFTVGTGTTAAIGAGTPASLALTGLTPATAYEAYVRQDCGGGDISSDVLITFTTPPLNDLCSGAEAVDVGLIGGYCTTGITTSNVGATASGVAAPSCAFGTIEDVWYSFVAPTSGEVMIEAAPTGGSPITDMVMALYDACGGTEIACDDDSGPGFFPFIQQAGLTPGNTYYVRCWEYNGGTSGEFDFCVTQPSAASNDNICGAFNLTPITNCSYQTYSNLDATLDPIPNTCGSILADVWFQVVVPASGDLILSSLPGAFSPLTDMVMEVYSSSDNTCTGTLTSVGCDDDSGPGAMPYLSLTGQVPGSTLFVRMSDFGFGSPDFGSFQLAAFPYAIWSGDISTAFPTAGNWCSQVTPASGDNVGIEAFPTNPMVLTAGVTVGDFLGNNPVTSLQIDPSVVMVVQGDAFVSNISVDGAISMGGSSAQTLNVGLPVTLGGLHIDNGAGVTYDNGTTGTGLSITGGLSLETGHLSIVGGSLTILSDAAGSGWVDDFSAGYTGSVDPITIEGYVPDNYIHFISSPINSPGLQAQYSEFGASGPDGVGVTPSVNCSPDSLGQGSAYSFVLEWREGGNSGTGWASACYQSGWHTRSSGNLTNGRAYSMAHPSGGPWTMSVTGPVNSGTVTYGGGLTATSGAPAQALGWHVIGNPFPSALDWNASAGTNLLGVANVWIGSSAYQGSYQNLNPGDDVAMHQGFAARTLTGGASWSPGPANRISGSVPLVREGGASSIGDYNVTINLSGGGYSHNTTVYFANETSPGNYPTTGFDGCCDGFFLPGSVQPYIYTVITDAPLPPAVVANEFQTNAMPLLTESYSVPMGLIVGVAGTYTLDAADLETLPAGFTVELEDTKLGVTQMLTDNPSYTFSAALNDDVDRFILHFNPGSVTDILEDVLVAGNIYATDEEIVVRLNTMEDFQGALDVYDLVGNLVMTSGQISVTNGYFSMDSEGLSTGVYVATLRSGEYSTENKIFIK